MLSEQRAGYLLLCVRYFQRLRQGHQFLDRLVVGFANFLSLVSIHFAEDLAESIFGGVCVLTHA